MHLMSIILKKYAIMANFLYSELLLMGELYPNII